MRRFGCANLEGNWWSFFYLWQCCWFTLRFSWTSFQFFEGAGLLGGLIVRSSMAWVRKGGRDASIHPIFNTISGELFRLWSSLSSRREMWDVRCGKAWKRSLHESEICSAGVCHRSHTDVVSLSHRILLNQHSENIVCRIYYQQSLNVASSLVCCKDVGVV